MNTVIVGTIDLVEVEISLLNDLSNVRLAIKTLVNARPFGEHSDQDLLDYVDLRKQEELLICQLS